MIQLEERNIRTYLEARFGGSARIVVTDARLSLQSVLDVLHRAVPRPAADQVLEAIDSLPS